MQMLAFWLGYQCSVGLRANLSEGAITWELCRLISSELSKEQFAHTEVMYAKIPALSTHADVADRRYRADIVITSHSKIPTAGERFPEGSISEVIEVKHNHSGIAQVWSDINYMSRVLTGAVNCPRMFLVYASANEWPDRFVKIDGTAIRTLQHTENQSPYRVRCVRKALRLTPKRGVKIQGNYAVLIEVFPNNMSVLLDSKTAKPNRARSNKNFW